MKELLEKLRDNNIVVHLADNDLKVKFSGSKLPEDVLLELRENKTEIVKYLVHRKKETSACEIEPVEKREYYPLSSSQRRLWILSRFERGNIAYNMTDALTFNGFLDMEALRYSFASVIKRHEILRTVFREADGEVRQFIQEPEEHSFTIPLFDMRETYNQHTVVKEKIRQEMESPVDLENGPLIKAIVYQIRDDQFLLYYSLHHIACDGWSIKVMTKELLYYYGLYGKKETMPLPPLKIHYKDFAVWQQTQLNNNMFSKHLAYWKEQFESPSPVLELPADKLRPVVKTYAGGYITGVIDKPLSTAFRSLCLKEGSTIFMGLLALLKTLFYRYTGTEDITIGSPIAGRDHLELDDQIGFYINTLALRTKFSGESSFRSLLHKEKEVTLEAYQYQSYPFDELVSVLKQKRDVSRNPLFDVMLVLLNSTFDVSKQNSGDENKNLSASVYEESKRTSALFDLRFSFKEKEYGLDASVEYNSDIFHEARIERMFRHLKSIMKLVINQPDLSIAKLNYLDDTELELLNNTFNSTTHQFSAERTLVDLFQEQASKSPTRVAAIFKNENRSFEQLDKASNKLANFLFKDAGLQKEDKVGVLVSKGFNQVISILSVLKAGGAYLPLDNEYPEDRLLYMLEDACVSVLLIEKSLAELGNRLLWRAHTLKQLVCIDSFDFYKEKSDQINTLMSKEMWDVIGNTSSNVIMGGGWMSSYTGEYFSEQEMNEYGENVLIKLKPFLEKKMKVLEIGCASGITTFQIAPFVGDYYATDLSSEILKRTCLEAEKKRLTNITFSNLAAHEIDLLGENEFDLVIVNSVIHCFNGLNYLRDVLLKILTLSKDTGIVFLGDVMDLAKKESLVQEMVEFKQLNLGKGYRTKVDWSKELFVPREYFQGLTFENIGFDTITFSEKIGHISNELTKFRFDALVQVNKTMVNEKTQVPTNFLKTVHSLTEIYKYPDNEFLGEPVSPDSLAYVIYTSGSSGKPKGCMLQHRGVVNRIEWMWSQYNFTAKDIVLQKTTFTFDVSVWEIFLPLCWGAKMVICEKTDIYSPERIRYLIKTHDVTCLHFVPGMMNIFVSALTNEKEIVHDLGSLRKVFSSGEALPMNTVKAWFSLVDLPIYNLYGPTEASVDVTYFNVEKTCDKVLIGKPIWNTYINIVDENGELVPVGVDGEICIGGVGLARGYIGQEGLTTARFIADPQKPAGRLYKTGDIGRWLQDGNIDYRGRKDEQIKIRGYRVELGEIEFCLKRHPDVKDATVIARLNKDNDTELVAYIISADEINYPNLRSFLAIYLPLYMVPFVYVRVAAFPLLSNGKIDRKSLPDPEGMALDSGHSYCPPETDLERELVAIIEEVLNRLPVSVLDDFFEVGGDSFKAIRLAAKFGHGLTLMDIYQHPKIRDLATFVESNRTRSILKLLSGDSQKCKSSLVIIPYGGGDPIAYQEVAAQMAILSDDVAVYCMALPRIVVDKTKIDFFEEMDVVVSAIIEEIKALPNTPITIYTKCVSGGLGLEVARRLELLQFPVEALCIGGAMALTQNPWGGPVFASNEDRIALLRRLGATVPDVPEEQKAFCDNVNFDIAVNLAAYTHQMEMIETAEYDRLSTPLYCIVGTIDPTTKNYQTRYRSWHYYAKEVSLFEIQDTGHYFSRDKPKELAEILNKICVPA